MTMLRIAAFLRAVDACVRAASNGVLAWLEKRRVAAAAFHDFETMSDRDLRDIGLSRADVNRVAWGASDRDREAI
jgi:uncharacterized protein YjiS (DUF1127 family)